MISIKPATRSLLLTVFKAHPIVISMMVILVLMNAIFEGLGMSLLLPIIEGLHDPEHFTPVHPLSQRVAIILNWFHIPFTIWVLFIICVGLFCIQAIVKYGRVLLAARVGSNILSDIRECLFHSLLDSRLTYIKTKKLGDLVNTFITETDWTRAAFQHLFNMLVEGVLALAYIGVIICISWKLSLIVLGFMSLLVIVAKKRRVIHAQGTNLSQSTDFLGSTVTEYLTGFRDIKLFGQDNHVKDFFRSISNKVSNNQYSLLKTTGLFSMVYDMAGVALLFVIVGSGWLLLGLTGAEVVVFLGILFRLVPRVSSCQSSADGYASTVPGVEVIHRVLNEVGKNKEPYTAGWKQPVFQSRLEFKDVSFSYEGIDQPTLSHLNLRVDQGKTFAIVGASGAGKSTLVDLIVRFHDPTFGAILIDGVDLKEINLKKWREMIGFVSQDTFLFHDTIANNIRFGSPNASDDQVITAAKIVCAHEFVTQMPKGYHTIVGDRGVRLSGGQRQRLCLARAMLRDPQILILDEATSDLDSKSEHLIEQSLAQLCKSRTVIVIAHRLATVEQADVIIVLQNGKIVEQGTHKELMHSRGYYAEFYQLQFRQNNYLHDNRETLTH